LGLNLAQLIFDLKKTLIRVVVYKLISAEYKEGSPTDSSATAILDRNLFCGVAMGHSNVWNSHPKNYGPGSRTWYVTLSLPSLSLLLFIINVFF